MKNNQIFLLIAVLLTPLPSFATLLQFEFSGNYGAPWEDTIVENAMYGSFTVDTQDITDIDLKFEDECNFYAECPTEKGRSLLIELLTFGALSDFDVTFFDVFNVASDAATIEMNLGGSGGLGYSDGNFEIAALPGDAVFDIFFITAAIGYVEFLEFVRQDDPIAYVVGNTGFFPGYLLWNYTVGDSEIIGTFNEFSVTALEPTEGSVALAEVLGSTYSVPEPSALLLLILGLAATGLTTRKVKSTS